MGEETQLARPEVAPVVAQMQAGDSVNYRCESVRVRRTSHPRPRQLSRAAKNYFATTRQSQRLILRKLMKNLLPLLFAVLVGVACFIPAPASAYRYHGRYYPYSYGGHYYRYRFQGHYYQYQYRGHYYRHRGWVVGVSGRPGYYRYW